MPATTTEKKQLRIATRNCGFIDPESIDDYIALRGYEALAKALTMTPAEVVELIKASGLRGRGGGGFPTGVKWGIALANAADQKYIVCNADEGDPGAFMDRAVLEGDPHSVVEAMAIGGYAIGATQGTVYIRAEYPLAIKRLKKAIDDARAYGLLGKNVFGSGFDFDIELKYGAGAFVCGEETALIRSMEGKRGEPVTKPPFPAQSGYWEKPTIVNNVETFANVPAIVLKGADWFSGIGTATTKGTKVFALAGKIVNVGLIEVPMGITLREVIFEIGGGCPDGKKFKAVQTGGPSGGALSYKDLDVAIDYESLIARKSMMGSGGMVVMDEDDCMVSVAKFFLDFTMDETCGKCTPCRIGSKRLYEMLDKITKGKGTHADLDRLKSLSVIIKDTALCGLGQTMPNPILSTMDTFADEYEAHIRDKKCPAHVCTALLTYTIDPAKCTGCTLCTKVCPVECISGTKKQPHTIDATRCIKCGACYDKCKFDSIIKQ
ncbi:NADH-ubiquinone oxidoreductase-F iron-sulfur binding region domain-containing protein [Solidesulfovibrio sp.]|uniref:NADH-ubiquinone oxidoreductase-F iron-sulfur binding region domain-containing protein n=1 Tax=Solidesulfovibrio sp. TaxID=2910990 RepID=UPI000EEC0AA5|nr:NADH-ubiquinone oxidoreductase-F iron-sulfur binding region domain-containing protein [Solidesulfovibrio sp.]MEA5087446.1 NADH-ubiquinone oxidoreductase-F iron-sulfur binding region domain-containing protein [Solidesulfovibrio sp.]HCR14296.1 NADH-quinone oxidoreductase subunit F [Desulfovibrio sp.]HML62041.1 NADH-ubiquinone oxidoreductase-F iron-sulfur binding region domain-containing protein [Solidesulfovibrio sp.]